MKPRFKGVIFDLDGTLLDTSQDLTSALNQVRALHHLPPVEPKQLMQWVGDGLRLTLERGLSEAPSQSLASAMEQFRLAYDQTFQRSTRAYRGVHHVLQTLQAHSLRLAVLSNKAAIYLEPLVRQHFPDIHFDALIGESEDVVRKPNPRGLKMILNQWRYDPAEVVLVGDSVVDGQVAINAQVSFIGVTWGFQSVQQLQAVHPSAFIAHPSELLTHLSLPTR